MHAHLYKNANKKTSSKLAVVTALAFAMSLTGCQTLKGGSKNNDSEFTAATNTAEGYYQKATTHIENGNFSAAVAQLKDLQLFYPAGEYSKQSLLDLMYVQFKLKKYEDAVASAEQFIRIYPNHPQADYAYYVQGVGNMQIPAASSLLSHNQAERDTSHYRLAYGNFLQLLQRFPNSEYAADSAQRMTYLFNQFAEHQIHISRWYIKRGSYVAAANRAKQVFQYYPKSESVPEAIAILAYSYDMMNLPEVAKNYKDLLAINYPEKLTANGLVILNQEPSFFEKITFGKFNKNQGFIVPPLTMATKTQVISIPRR